MYLKPKIFDNTETKNMMTDFRLDNVFETKAEERRMTREKTPTREEKVDSVGRFWSTTRLSNRHRARLTALLEFFTDERIEKMVVPIISVRSSISLRALDWFVINFAKKHKIALITHKSHIVNVYDNYRAWLKYWHRDLFDAFRRGTRIYFEYQDFTFSTTVAQINFLYWATVIGALPYAKDHIQDIEKDMNVRIAECKAEKAEREKTGAKRKRSELSQPSTVKCCIYTIPCTIHF
jgi:hypothetical protein